MISEHKGKAASAVYAIEHMARLFDRGVWVPTYKWLSNLVTVALWLVFFSSVILVMCLWDNWCGILFNE